MHQNSRKFLDDTPTLSCQLQRLLKSIAKSTPCIGRYARSRFSFALSKPVTTLLCIALTFTAAALSGKPGFTQTLLHTFDDPTPTTRDTFGTALAMDDNHILIGASDHELHGMDVGQAHLFDGSTGELLRTFDDPTPTEYGRFGASVAIDEEFAVITAPGDGSIGQGHGQVHLFNTASGELLKTINDPTPIEIGSFGDAVAIDGEQIFISEAVNRSRVGQVHLFSASGELVRSFSDPTPSAGENDGDAFGGSIAIDGNHLLVGAFFDDTLGSQVGQAHLFDIETGNLLWTFDNPNGAKGILFGRQVSIAGDHVLIGGGDASEGDGAYLFDTSSGELLHAFEVDVPLDDFGRATLVGNHVVISATEDDTRGPDVGRVYIFDAATHDLVMTLDDPTPTFRDHFGADLAMQDNRLLVGARGDDTNGDLVGQAHLFDISLVPEPAGGSLLVPAMMLFAACRRSTPRQKHLSKP